jgi:FXSXX-COOH protein
MFSGALPERDGDSCYSNGRPQVGADTKGTPVTGGSPDYDTQFVDVTEIPLERLLALGDSALGHSLRRLAQEISSPQDAVAGHNSAI